MEKCALSPQSIRTCGSDVLARMTSTPITMLLYWRVRGKINCVCLGDSARRVWSIENVTVKPNPEAHDWIQLSSMSQIHLSIRTEEMYFCEEKISFSSTKLTSSNLVLLIFAMTVISMQRAMDCDCIYHMYLNVWNNMTLVGSSSGCFKVKSLVTRNVDKPHVFV